VGVLLVGVPAALVVSGDTQPEAVRVDLLPHAQASFLLSRGSTTTVMWLPRLRMREAEPLARARMRRRVTPSSTKACEMYRSSPRRLSADSALAIALARTLYTGSLAACGANRRTSRASVAFWPRT